MQPQGTVTWKNISSVRCIVTDDVYQMCQMMCQIKRYRCKGAVAACGIGSTSELIAITDAGAFGPVGRALRPGKGTRRAAGALPPQSRAPATRTMAPGLRASTHRM